MRTPPNATPETRTPYRPRRTRRLGSAFVAAGAVALGGVATLPTGVAAAAGVTGGRLQHVATIPEPAETTDIRSATRGSIDPRRPTMRVRVTANGDVIPS